MQINDLIMIEVVLLCHLLAFALNIPCLGHDRPSDPDCIYTPVYLGHTVTRIIARIIVCLCTIVVYYILPLLGMVN